MVGRPNCGRMIGGCIDRRDQYQMFSVDHQTLLSRLTKFNFSEQVIIWMNSYLENVIHYASISVSLRPL